MRAALIALLAALLGFGAAGLIACGGEQRGGLEVGRADDLKGRLQAVRNAVADGDCERAAAALNRLRVEVEQVPQTVSKPLRARLKDGVEALETEAPEECADAADTKTTQSTPTTETQTEPPQETTPPPPEPQETVPEETTPTTPSVPEVPSTPVDPVPTVPDGTGGISPEAEGEIGE